MGGATKRAVLAVIVLLVLSVFIPNVASAASIVGSKHDFSFPSSGVTPFAGNFATATDGKINEVCVFCHTPLSANTDSVRETDILVWNRTNPTNAYDVYSSTTLDVAPDNPPRGITLMCMSCHDGITSIAVNTLLNAPGSGNPAIATDPPGSADQLGDIYKGDIITGWGANTGEGIPGVAGNTNLSNDHPVSFTWISDLLGMKTDAAIGFSDTTVKLFNNKMECATCHTVHDPAIPPFLRMTNVSSLMCLRCHDK